MEACRTHTQTQRILITGATGFIGRALLEHFAEQNHHVRGVDRQVSGTAGVACADLADPDQAQAAMNESPTPTVVIHAAALAHSETRRPKESFIETNTRITENVVRATRRWDPMFVLLSSVAVYGEREGNDPLSVAADTEPLSEYGASKLQCERIVTEASFSKTAILRLAPVYDEEHLKDLRKRVYMPGQRLLKFALWPSPRYSLCHLNALKSAIQNLVETGLDTCRVVRNVSDPEPIRQIELAKQFKGIPLPIPTILRHPAIWITRLLPRKPHDELRGLLLKLLTSNVYE